MPATVARMARSYTSSVDVVQCFATPCFIRAMRFPDGTCRMNAELRVHCQRHLSAYTERTPNDANTHAQRIDGSNRRRREA